MIEAKNALILWKMNDKHRITDLIVVPHEEGGSSKYREFECSGGACKDVWNPKDCNSMWVEIVRMLILYPMESMNAAQKALRELSKIEGFSCLEALLSEPSNG